MIRAFFFGCWNEAGHHLWEPGGRWPKKPTPFDMYRGVSLDANYAPLRRRARDGGGLCWAAQGVTTEDRQRIRDRAEEYPQGQFLLHRRDGFTLISWWDRQQGDERGACNSTFLLEGEHDAAAMVEQLGVHFPHVVRNLERGAVRLVEAS